MNISGETLIPRNLIIIRRPNCRAFYTRLSTKRHDADGKAQQNLPLSNAISLNLVSDTCTRALICFARRDNQTRAPPPAVSNVCRSPT